MQFILTNYVEPTSAFGLPDGEVLVMPAPGGQFIGPAVHSRSGVQVGFGTLSQYRHLESRFEVACDVGSAEFRFADNALEVRFEASDRSAALQVGQDLTGRFLQHLALEYGRPFTAEPRILEDAAGNVIPLPMILWRRTVTVYDLENLRAQVQVAAARCDLIDAVLDKALEYYEHSLYLASSAPTRTSFYGRQRTASHLLAGAFLFLWKALSVIVGDPSVDRDYQRRYQDLGLDYAFFRDVIEDIRRLRNDEDVAHYRLDDTGLEAVRQKFNDAKVAVRRVVVAYADQLRARPKTGKWPK